MAWDRTGIGWVSVARRGFARGLPTCNYVSDHAPVRAHAQTSGEIVSGAEHVRLDEADEGTAPWRAWGPYLAERAWGTVREDYSDSGASWHYFPHDDARSRAYRWNEDGLAGISDDRQTFCFALAMWNERDAILKERIFGLAGPEGNHGEDAKEYWWYLDSTPTHSWMTWRYHYPQEAFPYWDLVHTNWNRGRSGPQYNLVDTDIFDDNRYWAVTVDYAKAGPTDLCVRVTVANRGAERCRMHLLPTLWFRNTWAWDIPEPGKPTIHALRADDTGPARLVGEHADLGRITLRGDGDPTPLACDNETNEQRISGGPSRSPYPKDGINDHLIHGAATVNPDGVGTKAALRYILDVAPGEEVRIRLRLSLDGSVTLDEVDTTVASSLLGTGFDEMMATRHAEADEFFAGLTPPSATPDEALVVRQAIAGLMWTKQFFHFDVARWLAGDPTIPVIEHRAWGRNARWAHMRCHDVISVPDAWEYPWYACWDLAFHAVAIARADPGYAKEQVLLLLQDRYMRRNGQLPAYEWAFDDVNPPVHAWAALRVFEIDGSRDHDFLGQVMHKLLLNFNWWVNSKDSKGNGVFGGGFLGLDNVAPFDRSGSVPIDGTLDQSDGTAWMAMFALNMMDIALVLARKDRSYRELAATFLEQFATIAAAMYEQDLWDESDGFFYDVVRAASGGSIPMKVRSVVGLLPLAAVSTLDDEHLTGMPGLKSRLEQLSASAPGRYDIISARHTPDAADQRLLAVAGADRLVRVLAPMLDEAEFLSPYGVRSLSAVYRDEPYAVWLGGQMFTVPYEPGDSTHATFGGNSNWHGPIWYPTNYLLIESLRRYARFFGADLTVEYPTGSGTMLTLDRIADDLSARLVRGFLNDDSGRRPIFGDVELFQRDPGWHDLLPFHEYFHGDTGAGMGASHQTGWTALVAELIFQLHDTSADDR